MPYFFVYPFAVSGDRAAIPTTDPMTGTMSYQDGFTENYELVLGTDPDAIPVPRDQSNQLYFDITDNINQYQTQGIPNWITSADNLGSPYSYGIYAVVRYDAGSGIKLYESQVNSNTSTPGADNNWLVISGNFQGVPIGTIIDFGGVVLPAGYLACDGSAVSRTTYSTLLSTLTQTQTVTLTSASPTFTVGSTFGIYGDNGAIPGMKLEGTGIPAGTRVLSIVGNVVTMSANASPGGTVPVTFFGWGNGDGSTTFNVPNFQRRVAMGNGGTATATIGSQVGQIGGAETVTLDISQMPNHKHDNGGGSTTALALGKAADAGGGANIIAGTSYTFAVNVAAQGGGGAHNNIQPSAITYKCIKYS